MATRLSEIAEDVPLPSGFRAAGVHCGLKAQGALDLGLLVADEPVAVAAMFTRNALLGAHIPVCKEHLARSGGRARAILVNARNANCATGDDGIAAARRCCEELARRLDCPTEQVLMVSTGVIGRPLPTERIVDALDDLIAAAADDSAMRFARAIMTTDTYPKACSGGAGRAVGFAKGSGMIHPDMATMLGFLLHDAFAPAAASPASLQACLQRIADRSFHRVTVDGDTSPNDSLFLLARIAADGHQPGGDVDSDPEHELTAVATELAKHIAADGEGATRLVTVEVRGAEDERQATRVARLIATSPLVKTAIAGRDPNWGRIAAAAGRADVSFSSERMRVWVGAQEVYADGRPHPDREPAASEHLRDEQHVVIGIDLAIGDADADAWTCDLTADYVRINADYRT